MEDRGPCAPPLLWCPGCTLIPPPLLGLFPINRLEHPQQDKAVGKKALQVPILLRAWHGVRGGVKVRNEGVFHSNAPLTLPSFPRPRPALCIAAPRPS